MLWQRRRSRRFVQPPAAADFEDGDSFDSFDVSVISG